MTELAVRGPLDEPDLHDDFGTDPMRAHSREANELRERPLGDLERVEPRTKFVQQSSVEPGADFSSEHEIVFLKITNEQSAEPHALPLRIGEAADDELLCQLAFHLEPVLRSAVLVRRPLPLGDDAFPSLIARKLPGPLMLEQWNLFQRATQAKIGEKLPSLFERQAGDVAAFEPHHVEHVIRSEEHTS